jgi:hypothetical protein
VRTSQCARLAVCVYACVCVCVCVCLCVHAYDRACVYMYVWSGEGPRTLCFGGVFARRYRNVQLPVPHAAPDRISACACALIHRGCVYACAYNCVCLCVCLCVCVCVCVCVCGGQAASVLICQSGIANLERAVDDIAEFLPQAQACPADTHTHT